MPDLPAPLPPALPATRPAMSYACAAHAPATLRAYQAGWQAFSEWCQLAGRAALPATPGMMAEHLASLREAEVVIESWRRHDNTVRPHDALGYRPPASEVVLPALAAWPPEFPLRPVPLRVCTRNNLALCVDTDT